MKKIYQTIVGGERSNCMQAAVASLFELPLQEVPNFIAFGEQWLSIMQDFYKVRGYDMTTMFAKKDKWTLKDIAEFDGGVDGYFSASVPSQTFEDCSHAVIVDTDLNIVHDPNPNQKALELGPEDVTSIDTVGHWHIDTEGNFVRYEN